LLGVVSSDGSRGRQQRLGNKLTKESTRMIAPFLSKLLEKLSDEAIDNYKSAKEFQRVKAIANERISRELFWNNECLSYASTNQGEGHLHLVRTSAFDELVSTGVPLDLIFEKPLDFSPNAINELEFQPPKEYAPRLKGIKSLSMLIDRTYHRLWMLQKRRELGIAGTDIAYVRALVRLTNNYVTAQRHCHTWI